MLKPLALGMLVAIELAQTAVPATLLTRDEAAEVLKTSIAKGIVDQPITARDVLGGKASVAMLHRTKPEVNALVHDRVTETYYILQGAGTLVTGGTLGSPKPTDLTRLNAGMSQTGTRQGGESRRVGPGDTIIIPAGTPHSFSVLDGPISYLVFRFEPSPQ